MALPPQPLADIGRPPVLPDDGAVDRLAGLTVPDDCGLALIGDANARDPVCAACLGYHRLRTGKRQVPDFLGIMLDKARLRIMLRERALATVEGGPVRGK